MVKCLLYFNGEQVGRQDDTSTSFKSSTVPLILGGGVDNAEGTSRIFPGSIDEVRISTVARSSDWVKASHDTVTESSFARYSSARENVKTGRFLIFR